MKVSEYDDFVNRTDQSKTRSRNERKRIALYGLAGEIGSLLSAVKKKILSEGGRTAWDQPSDEIKEELGDALWYCFAVARAENEYRFDVLASNIELTKREIGAHNERAETIRAVLEPGTRESFLSSADSFPPSPDYCFSDYQTLAFKSARTNGLTLLEVCLAVLAQLAAELLRQTLPEIELSLNKDVPDRPCNSILGDVAWHLAAIASLYHLSLDEVAKFNQQKVGFRAERGLPTRLHDEGRPSSEQLPRLFDIAFVHIARGKSRMYFEGRRLGDDLTDNSNQDDGYRFHDVMHLAFLAHLGWSPVIRGMMRRKRPDVDQVEDSGRAKVVEELVIKAIHSEGERISQESGRCQIDGPVPLFPDRTTIPFSLVKTLRHWVQGLEVYTNTYWEWEDAIYSGCEIFHLLRQHKQGTVRVDLLQRRVTFEAVVSPNIAGVTVGLGIASLVEGDVDDFLSSDEIARANTTGRSSETAVAKKALLQALSLPTDARDQLEIHLLSDNQVSVSATGHAQNRIWDLGVIDFRVAFAGTADGAILCSALAIADPYYPRI